MKKKILSTLVTLLLLFNFTLPAYGYWLAEDSLRVLKEVTEPTGVHLILASLMAIQVGTQLLNSIKGFKGWIKGHKIVFEQKGIRGSQIFLEREFKLKLIEDIDDPLERPHRGPRGVPFSEALYFP